MKKVSIILIIIISLGGLQFQSCKNNPDANNQMQKPITETSVHPSDSLNKIKNSSENESDEKSESKTEEKTERKSGNSNTPKTAMNINYENLLKALIGETTASEKYAAFSKKAESEGYHEIAVLFYATSNSEKIHANNHKAVLEEANQKIPQFKTEYIVKSTMENLRDAIAGETYEINSMYPQFLTVANNVGNQLSLVSLNYAYKTEQKHKVLYDKALIALETNNLKSLSKEYYICPTCGNTYERNKPKRCGISMTNSDKFIKIGSLKS